ncbi:hypothetical protein Q9X96_003122 [Vibrio vulnificus]|nr:hypothetical protein [Vibrio vulnificus]
MSNIIQFPVKSAKHTAFGVGIVDLPTSVTHNNGKNTKVYSMWTSMLQRCYSAKFHETYPQYIGCSVCDEWLTFSNFKTWFDEHYIEGYQLDKDILVEGNKIYCPTRCVFVPKAVNVFCANVKKRSQDLPTGVNTAGKKFKVTIFDPVLNKPIYYGVYNTVEEAHNVYLTKKQELAYEVVQRYEMPVLVKLAVINRFIPKKAA